MASCRPRRCEPLRTAVGEVSELKTMEAACATMAGCSAMPEGEAVEAPSTVVPRDSSTGREVSLRRTTSPGALALDQLLALVTLSGIHASRGGAANSGTGLGAGSAIAGHESSTSRKVRRAGGEASALEEGGLELIQCLALDLPEVRWCRYSL
jgi:hypothetical protein